MAYRRAVPVVPGAVMDSYDAPRVLFSAASVRKAKKEHVCSFCRRRIKPGERYFYYVEKSEEDDTLTQTKACSPMGRCIEVLVTPSEEELQLTHWTRRNEGGMGRSGSEKP